MSGSMSYQGLAPTVFLTLKLPSGQEAFLGYVSAVPPERADVEYDGKRYVVRGVLWRMNHTVDGQERPRRADVLVELDEKK